MKTANLKSHTTSEMNWNIYFQAFTVRTWRKRLSNLNTFLTPHIYWGIHITICVNYNQHTGEVIRALSMRDAGKRMTIFPSPSRSASFFPGRVSLSFIPAQPMFIRRRLKRRRWPIRRMPTFFISFHLEFFGGTEPVYRRGNACL